MHVLVRGVLLQRDVAAVRPAPQPGREALALVLGHAHGPRPLADRPVHALRDQKVLQRAAAHGPVALVVRVARQVELVALGAVAPAAQAPALVVAEAADLVLARQRLARVPRRPRANVTMGHAVAAELVLLPRGALALLAAVGHLAAVAALGLGVAAAAVGAEAVGRRLDGLLARVLGGDGDGRLVGRPPHVAHSAAGGCRRRAQVDFRRRARWPPESGSTIWAALLLF